MRIPLLGISHETNTFSSVPADYAAFEATGILRGQEIFDKFRDASYTISGYMQSARGTGIRTRPSDVRRNRTHRHNHQRRL